MSNKKITKQMIMEQIALNLLAKKKSYNEIFSEQYLKSLEENSNNDINKEKDEKEETKKDKIYIAKQQLDKIAEKNKYDTLNKLKNKQKINSNNKKSNDDLKLCTTINNTLTDYYCCKKNKGKINSLIEEENEKNNYNNYTYNNRSLLLNNINNNLNNNLINIEINDENLYIIDFLSSEDLINTEIVNINEYKKILQIYKYLMNNFYFNLNHKNENKNNNSDIIKLLSKEFLDFIFNGNLTIILPFFKYSIDIIKYIFYQIFIFLSILYFDDLKDINESYEMSFKSIFLYSQQNFQLILDIISNPTFYNNQEVKISKSFLGRNKIIYSILKTFEPKNNNSYNNNIFNNSDKNNDNIFIYKYTYKLIEEIENSSKKIRTKEIRNNIYNKLDKYIINLKSNINLQNKIKSLEKINSINIESILNNVSEEEEKEKNNQNNSQKILSLKEPMTLTGELKYKYTLFIELDETLVHYYEEGENYFVKVRQGTEELLKSLHEFCEIIIVSTSSKEYTDIILENLNKEKKYINKAIYKELCDNDNIEIDFRKINRDIIKTIFICHNGKDFFNAPENNIIELKEFNGEEDDKEIIYLHEELIKLKENISDVRDIIKEANNIIEQKRKEKNEN